ncbi:hypothetical protein [Thermotoga profunda]|uniref:hypothetical protein n=1 Tax=Thermotoga profunda TaxID=1508420 RepID=UPI00059744E3|nr:hypothetical protein [Thermotoga profunda]
MSLLKDFMKIYKKSVKDFQNTNLIRVSENKELSLRDVFAVYTTHLPIYGIVTDKTKDKITFVYLTTFLPLASVEAIEVKIKDLFDTVKLTHMTFEIDCQTIKPFAKILGPVKDLQTIKENVHRLREINYGTLHREFFEDERRRVEIILQLMREDEKIIYVPSSVLEKFKQFAQQKAVAATEKKTIRVNCAIVVCEDLGLRFFFSDECENKIGKIYLLNEPIFSGHLISGLLIRNLGDLVHYVSEQTMRIEVQNEDNKG